MAVINANLVEIEVQEQSKLDENSFSPKFMVKIKYEINEFGPVEIASILLTNNKPIITNTLDTSKVVVKKTIE